MGQDAGSDEGGERNASVGLVLVLCASLLSGIRWSVTQLLLKDMAAAAPAAPDAAPAAAPAATAAAPTAPAAAPPACVSPPATREASGAACGGDRAVPREAVPREAVPREADAPCAEEGGGSGGGRYSACRGDIGETSPRGLDGGSGSSPAAARGGGGGAAGEHQGGGGQGGAPQGGGQGGVHPLAMVLAISPFGLALLLPIALALELDEAQRWQPAPHIDMLGFFGRVCRGPRPHPHPTPSP